MWRSARKFAVNTLVVVVSTVIGYVALQLVFFRVLLTDVHLPVRPWLPETAGVLVQSTKAAPIPHKYVAIVGDSYAEGVGDYLMKAGDDDSHGFNAAHVIHEMTGRDVVTFGKGGAGSAEAFVLLPSRAIKGSQCLIFPAVGDPDEILAYFFEGNDIEDNLRFLDKVHQKYGRAGTPEIDAYLINEYTAYQPWRCHMHLTDVLSRIVRFQYLYYTGKMELHLNSETHPNEFLVASKPVQAAPTLGPALELENAEIEAGIQVFDRSLVWLRKRFPQANIKVVYIPSPLALYHSAAPEIEARFLANMAYVTRQFPAARVAQRTEQICDLVRTISEREHIEFINPGPTLREAASVQAIHGPVDWEHFNEIGYRYLGEVLAHRLSTITHDKCGNPGVSAMQSADNLAGTITDGSKSH